MVSTFMFPPYLSNFIVHRFSSEELGHSVYSFHSYAIYDIHSPISILLIVFIWCFGAFNFSLCFLGIVFLETTLTFWFGKSLRYLYVVLWYLTLIMKIGFSIFFEGLSSISLVLIFLFRKIDLESTRKIQFALQYGRITFIITNYRFGVYNSLYHRYKQTGSATKYQWILEPISLTK